MVKGIRQRQSGAGFMDGLKAAARKAAPILKKGLSMAKDSGLLTKGVDAAAALAGTALGPAGAAAVNTARGVLKATTGVGMRRVRKSHGGALYGRRGFAGVGTGSEFNMTEGTKAQVWHGTAKHTRGKLSKGDLMQNKWGRIVSKKQHANGLRMMQDPAIKAKFDANKIKKKGSE